MIEIRLSTYSSCSQQTPCLNMMRSIWIDSVQNCISMSWALQPAIPCDTSCRHWTDTSWSMIHVIALFWSYWRPLWSCQLWLSWGFRASPQYTHPPSTSQQSFSWVHSAASSTSRHCFSKSVVYSNAATGSPRSHPLSGSPDSSGPRLKSKVCGWVHRIGSQLSV